MAAFHVMVDRDRFIFLDPAADPGGDGRIDSPLRTFADVHRGSRADRTFSGKILYLRDGVHRLTGPDDSNGNFRIPGDNKPLVWLGYPGEDAVIDASTAVVNMIDRNSGNDAFFSGFTMRNSRPDVSNSRFFFFGGGLGDRSTFFELDFMNLVSGTAGNDNPGAIVRFRSNFADYFVVMNSTIRDYAAPMVGSIYSTRYAVVEGNELGPSTIGSAAQGIFPKAHNDLWSIRRNVSLHNRFSAGGAIHNHMGDCQRAPQRIEIAYNLIDTRTDSPWEGDSIRYNWSAGCQGHDSSVWVYRNTAIGRMRALNSEFNADFEKNIVWNSAGSCMSLPSNAIIMREGNLCNAGDIDGFLDGAYGLRDQYREFRGTHGHEISR